MLPCAGMTPYEVVAKTLVSGFCAHIGFNGEIEYESALKQQTLGM